MIMKKLTVFLLVFTLFAAGCDVEEQPEIETEQPELEIEVEPEPETEEEVLESEPETASGEVPEGSAVVEPQENLDFSPEVALAKCLTDKGVKLYTSPWCGYCQLQKEAFRDGVRYLNEIDCSAMDGWSIACKEAGITAVPAWVFPDGTTKTGATPLEQLAELTECSYVS